MIIIRPFQSDDRKALITLWREAGLATPANNADKDIERKLQVDPELLLIALQETDIVGSVMGGYEGHRGWINYLAVAKKVQRQGIASRLMHEVEARLLAKGCPKINLQVRTTNSNVLAFYASLGYLDDKVISLGKRLIHDA